MGQMINIVEFLVKKHIQHMQYNNIIICNVETNDMYDFKGICDYKESMFYNILDDIYDEIIELKSKDDNTRFTLLMNICKKLDSKYKDLHFISNSYITYNKYKELYKNIKQLKSKNKYFGIYVQDKQLKKEQFLIVI